MPPRLVPELDVLDLDESLRFYVETIGFVVAYARPEERFAYLDLDGAHLMLEEAAGPGRRFHDRKLERPLGTGMNLQIEVADVGRIHAGLGADRERIVVDLEKRWYRRGAEEIGNHQFVIADPDGYLLRFFSSLGSRPAG